MFDIAPSELLLVAVVALLVIGPKDMPMALRSVGRWVGKLRQMSNHFRAGVDAMIREAELAEIEKEWRERNARIMAEYPDAEAHDAPVAMEPIDRAAHPDAAAEAAIARAAPVKAPEHDVREGSGEGIPAADEPELPLAPRRDQGRG